MAALGLSLLSVGTGGPCSQFSAHSSRVNLGVSQRSRSIGRKRKRNRKNKRDAGRGAQKEEEEERAAAEASEQGRRTLRPVGKRAWLWQHGQASLKPHVGLLGCNLSRSGTWSHLDSHPNNFRVRTPPSAPHTLTLTPSLPLGLWH